MLGPRYKLWSRRHREVRFYTEINNVKFVGNSGSCKIKVIKNL